MGVSWWWRGGAVRVADVDVCDKGRGWWRLENGGLFYVWWLDGGPDDVFKTAGDGGLAAAIDVVV
jgi:hypothetical protein